jgi:hypothetical protein
VRLSRDSTNHNQDKTFLPAELHSDKIIRRPWTAEVKIECRLSLVFLLHQLRECGPVIELDEK